MNFYKNRIHELEHELNKKESETQILNETLKNRELIIQNLKEKIDSLIGMIEKQDSSSNNVFYLKKRNQELENSIMNLSKSLQNKEKIISEFNSVCEFANKKFSLYENNNEYLKKENEGLRSTIEKLQIKLSDLVNTHNSYLENTRENVCNELMDENFEKLKLEYSILRKRYNKLECIISDKNIELHKNLQQKDTEFEEIAFLNEKLKKELNELETKFKESSKLNHEKIKEFEENEAGLKKKIINLERVLSDYQKEISDFKEIFKNSSIVIKNLTEENQLKEELNKNLQDKNKELLYEINCNSKNHSERESVLNIEINKLVNELKLQKHLNEEMKNLKEEEVKKNIEKLEKITEMADLLDKRNKQLTEFKEEKFQQELNQNIIRQLKKDLRELDENHILEISKLKNQIIKRDDEINIINSNYEQMIHSLKTQISSGKLLTLEQIILEIEKIDLGNKLTVSSKLANIYQFNDPVIKVTSPKKTLENLNDAIQRIDARLSNQI